ncbi:MAG: IS607 family transposase [Rivularia sp. (in: cyanobacteria)]
MSDKYYIKPNEAAKRLGVSLHTLRRWEKKGLIETIRTDSGQRRYNVEGYLNGIQTENRIEKARSTILYARVSTRPQRNDLNRQAAKLIELYPEGRLVKEIAGGLNLRRKGLLGILERVLLGDVETIVVAHKDRLARFGFDLIEWLCEKHKCKIVVLHNDNLSPHQELVADIIAILHSFSSRLYSIRRIENKVKEELQKESETQEKQEASSKQDSKD